MRSSSLADLGGGGHHRCTPLPLGLFDIHFFQEIIALGIENSSIWVGAPPTGNHESSTNLDFKSLDCEHIQLYLWKDWVSHECQGILLQARLGAHHRIISQSK